MTQQQIDAARPAEKLAHPERYCSEPGCLLHNNGGGYCPVHAAKHGITQSRTPYEIQEERCPTRE